MKLTIATTLLFASIPLIVLADEQLNLSYSDPTAIQRALVLLQNPGTTSFDDTAAPPDRKRLISGPITCRTAAGKLVSCLPSDITTKALTLLVDSDLRSSLDALIAAEGLSWDHEALKTMIVGVSGEDQVDHVDFVGLVRKENEALSAPDAVSRFVIRLRTDGTQSIVERAADDALDVNAIKFSFEE